MLWGYTSISVLVKNRKLSPPPTPQLTDQVTLVLEVCKADKKNTEGKVQAQFGVELS